MIEYIASKNVQKQENAESLALDEALWSFAKTSSIRIWEFNSICVVVGRGSKSREEIDIDACKSDGVPIYRRTTGGASILGGPGCLMYSVIIHHEDPAFRLEAASIDATHDAVLRRNASGLSRALPDAFSVQKSGTSDLALVKDGQPLPRKFSGNSMRRGQHATLYHGTILYDFDLDLIPRYLTFAPRQPEYRAGRDHRDFVTNLPLAREAIKNAIQTAWSPDTNQDISNETRLEASRLVKTKYGLESWNLRH